METDLRKLTACFAVCLLSLTWAISKQAHAQSFGVALQNTMMPASGGMAGTSIAAPQDVLSTIHLNPASLRQYRGTHFSLGGSWIEPTYDIGNTGGVLPNIGAFSAKSQAQGTLPGNIGVSQDLTAFGLPVTTGVGLIALAGAGLNVANVPASNGTASSIALLQLGSGVGVDVTDRLALGGSFGVINASFTGLFTGSSNPAIDYSVRGQVGFNYRLKNCSRVAGYYQTNSNLRFDNAIILSPPGGGPIPPNQIALNVPLELPHTLGLGISNDQLMGGRLLLAADFSYFLWGSATLFDAIYKDQFGVQIGSQFRVNNRIKLRLGYIWNENPLRENVGFDIGDITVGTNALQYIQAQFATINQHKFAGGIGITDVLPGVDFDFFAGGMPEASQQFGASFASLQSYWLGGGFSWRFRRGSGGCNIAPDEWCTACN